MSKVYTTAVVIIPPEKIWETIQKIRRTYDRQFHRWMPHITLLYPFKPQSYFKELDFAVEGWAYQEFIRDISAGGLFIETRSPMAVGQDITLAFELPHTSEHVKIRGKIARVLPSGGFGVKRRPMTSTGKSGTG